MSPTLRGPLSPAVGSALTGKSLLGKMRVTPNYNGAPLTWSRSLEQRPSPIHGFLQDSKSVKRRADKQTLA